jgi:hypothetical protein
MYLKLDRLEQGLRTNDVLACFIDLDGHEDFLNVERSFLSQHAGDYFLPVGVVRFDRPAGRVLIELPQESWKGTWRFWFPESKLRGVSEIGASA